MWVAVGRSIGVSHQPQSLDPSLLITGKSVVVSVSDIKTTINEKP